METKTDNKKCSVVLGFAFGDEAKGVTVQELCKKAISNNEIPLVIRFNGGPQAGHTIFNNDVEHICSSYGAGVLTGARTYITETAFFDPISAYIEYKLLCSGVSDFNPNAEMLFVNKDTEIITYYDVIAGQKDKKVTSDGSCGKGIYATFKRVNDGVSFKASDLIKNPYAKLAEVRNYYNISEDDRVYSVEESLYSAKYSFPFVIVDEMPDADHYIFEGAQGLLLDMDYGFDAPHLTPSHTGLVNISDTLDKYNDVNVYLVTRSYLTRHGAGYVPKEPVDFDLANKYESNVYNEYQKEFKVGKIEPDLLNYAIKSHNLSKYNYEFNLVISHTDVIPGAVYEYCLDNIINKLDFQFKRIYFNDKAEGNLKQVD